MPPERIVALAAEVPAMLAAVGQLSRLVGISAYTRTPSEALSLPKVSGFSHASLQRILSVEPDLAIVTSTVQSRLAAELVEHGVSVLHLAPYRLQDVALNFRLVASVVGAERRAEVVWQGMERTLSDIEDEGRALSWHPRVYFEEWPDPIIAGIGWVSDCITLAGGVDVFRERALDGHAATARHVATEDVVHANPDVILAAWCGKPVVLSQILERPGWSKIRAVADGAVHPVDDSILEAGLSLPESARGLADLLRSIVNAR